MPPELQELLKKMEETVHDHEQMKVISTRPMTPKWQELWDKLMVESDEMAIQIDRLNIIRSKHTTAFREFWVTVEKDIGSNNPMRLNDTANTIEVMNYPSAHRDKNKKALQISTTEDEKLVVVN